MRTLASIALFITLAALLAGCSAHNTTAPGGGALSVRLAIPATSRSSIGSVTIQLDGLASGSTFTTSRTAQNLTAGSPQTLTFVGVPAGSIRITGKSFTSTNGTGTPLAIYLLVANAGAGGAGSPMNIIHDGAVDTTLTITPATPRLVPGASVTLVANAKNAAGQTVPVDNNDLTWSVPPTASFLSVSGAGVITAATTATPGASAAVTALWSDYPAAAQPSGATTVSVVAAPVTGGAANTAQSTWTADPAGWQLASYPTGCMTVDANGKPWTLMDNSSSGTTTYRVSRFDSATATTDVPLPATYGGFPIIYLAVKAYGPALYVFGYRYTTGGSGGYQNCLTLIDINNPAATPRIVTLDTSALPSSPFFYNCALDPGHSHLYAIYPSTPPTLYQFDYVFPASFPSSDAGTTGVRTLATLTSATAGGLYGMAVRTDGSVVTLNYLTSPTVSNGPIAIDTAGHVSTWTAPSPITIGGTTLASMLFSLTYSPSTNNTYCMNATNDTIAVYDGAGTLRGAFTDSADAFNAANGIAVNSAGTLLYVCDDDASGGVRIRSYHLASLSVAFSRTPTHR